MNIIANIQIRKMMINRALVLRVITLILSRFRLLLGLILVYLLMRTLLIYSQTRFRDQINLGINLPNLSSFMDDDDITDEDQATKVPHLQGFLAGDIGDKDVVHITSAIKVQDLVKNCGLPESCPPNHFAVHLFSGKDHHDAPQLCIDGKFLANSKGGGGRGINLAIVDNVTRYIQKVAHFDTYEEDSSGLEALLLSLRVGDIIVLITFDEPTKRLSPVARLLFHEFGSAMAQNLHYRSSWYVITQKGINGFTPYEELHFTESKGWPAPHDINACIPFQINGLTVHPDPMIRENPQRRQFCHQHYQRFPSFCHDDLFNEPLETVAAVRHTSSKIYDVPIMVLAGKNEESLPSTLETLYLQPGIVSDNIQVFYSHESREMDDICSLFNASCQFLNHAMHYCDQVVEAFEVMENIYPQMSYVMIIEEDVLIGPDYMEYMAQLLSMLEIDSTLSGISAWNDNGFQSVSSDPHRLYRVESHPSFAFVVRKQFPIQDWCELRKRCGVTETFQLDSCTGMDILIPEVSRVLRLPGNLDHISDHLGLPPPSLQHFLNLETRKTQDTTDIPLRNVGLMERKAYDKYIEVSIVQGYVWKLSADEMSGCTLTMPDVLPSVSLIVYYQQRFSYDVSTLNGILKCFNISNESDVIPKGIYRDLFRFTFQNREIFMVGLKSPYANGYIPII